MREGDLVCAIVWHTNPFRGDKFEERWKPAAQAAVDYGATSWAFLRSRDDPSDFTQMAVFDSKTDFERYWYSEELAEARADCSGLFQVPVLPVYWRVAGAGELAPASADA